MIGLSIGDNRLIPQPNSFGLALCGGFGRVKKMPQSGCSTTRTNDRRSLSTNILSNAFEQTVPDIVRREKSVENDRKLDTETYARKAMSQVVFSGDWHGTTRPAY
jgi:hypothetical protein